MRILLQKSTAAARAFKDLSSRFQSLVLAAAAAGPAAAPSASSAVRKHQFASGQHHRPVEIVVDPRSQSQRNQQQSQKRQQRERRSSYASRSKSRRGRYSPDSFVDCVRLRVQGGDGGKGSLSMHSLRRKRKLRPDGGHGGRGGHVVLVADPYQLGGGSTSFSDFHPHVAAEKGGNGEPQRRSGRGGDNRIVRVPCGVVVKRVLDDDDGCEVDEDGQDFTGDGYTGAAASATDEGETYHCEDEIGVEIDVTKWNAQHQGSGHSGDHPDEGDRKVQDDYTEIGRRRQRKTEVLADLDRPGAHVLVARGGRGGLGSCLYASDHGRLPDADFLIRNAQGEPGEVQHLELELKLIADVGLCGFPNAGKSSLLCAMSRARPKVAPYPFTTLHPILGCVEYRDGFRVRVADIPGLIEGASRGRGQGHDFLRHVERTKALLYVLDAAGVDDGRDPLNDLMVLADELDSYGDGRLLERRALIVANKVDLLAPERVSDLVQEINEASKEIGIQCEQSALGISAGVTGQGLSKLSTAIRDIVIRTDKDRSDVLDSVDAYAG